MVHLMTVQ